MTDQPMSEDRDMKQPKTIKIDNIEYVRADSVQPPSGDLELVVADRGWVFVGRVDRSEEGVVWVRDAKNVRTWSTVGYGGLTKGAKHAKAVLDPSNDLRFRADAVLFTTPLAEGWEDA